MFCAREALLDGRSSPSEKMNQPKELDPVALTCDLPEHGLKRGQRYSRIGKGRLTRWSLLITRGERLRY
jgi:hypothetical protein